jgi:hypothetical protein
MMVVEMTMMMIVQSLLSNEDKLIILNWNHKISGSIPSSME